MYPSTTDELNHTLQSVRPDMLPDFFAANSEHLLDGDRPFTAYMRNCFAKRKIVQAELFGNVDIPPKYGYKLISGEKHTKERDIIFRICLGAGFTLKETQTALTLYGMSPLYPRFKRDAVLISVISSGVRSTLKTDELLIGCGMKPLRSCGEAEAD